MHEFCIKFSKSFWRGGAEVGKLYFFPFSPSTLFLFFDVLLHPFPPFLFPRPLANKGLEELQRKSNFVHFSLKIRHLVTFLPGLLPHKERSTRSMFDVEQSGEV